MSWTPEMREEVVAAYVEREPTPENSMDIVAELAEEFEQSVNGVRMVLVKAEVYIKKTPEAKSKGNSGGGRVSKAGAQETLTAAITDAGQEPDAEIIKRLTGKAAVYFTEVINNLA